MNRVTKKQMVWISHVLPWIGFLVFLWPLIRLVERVGVFPPDFNVNGQAILLYLIALFSFYGTFLLVRQLFHQPVSEKTKRSQKKRLKGLFYLIAIIFGCVFAFFIFRENSFSDMQQLMVSLQLDVFMFFVFLGVMIQFQHQANDYNNSVRMELNKAQLALLRSQINPHFLYNTLHNIDTLIVKNPDKASESIIMLSDIMRYMMQEVQSEQVALSNEIEHLRKYIALERLRLKKDTFVQFEVDGSSEGLFVAPMLMIPFVENAFKHAVDSDCENGIQIHILIRDKRLIFNCNNKFDPMETEKDKTHGIGISTVRKRLDLIYPNAHLLIISPENTAFKILMEIQLNAH